LQENYGGVLENDCPTAIHSQQKRKENEKEKETCNPDLNQRPQDGRQTLHSCVLPT